MAAQSLMFEKHTGVAVASATVSQDELATALQLVRAASLQTTRLQLAILCREPQPVLESFDSLAAMDRELERFVNAIAPPDDPASGDALRSLAALVAGQKTSLASEKMALVSGSSGPLFRETASDNSALSRSAETNHDAIPNSGMDMARSEYRPSGRLHMILVLVAIMLLVAGAVAWFTILPI